VPYRPGSSLGNKRKLFHTRPSHRPKIIMKQKSGWHHFEKPPRVLCDHGQCDNEGWRKNKSNSTAPNDCASIGSADIWWPVWAKYRNKHSRAKSLSEPVMNKRDHVCSRKLDPPVICSAHKEGKESKDTAKKRREFIREHPHPSLCNVRVSYRCPASSIHTVRVIMG
jgi:hypothetical protein